MPILDFMDISSVTQSVLLNLRESGGNSPVDNQRTLLSLRQAQNQAKVEGEALVELINQAPSPLPSGKRIDIYA